MIILNEHNVKGYNIVIFMAITNILYCDFVGFNYLIDNFKQNAWIAILFLFIINIFICLFFKGFNKTFHPLKELSKNNLIRIITIIYITASSIFLIIYSSIIIKNYFYFESPIQIFILITIITSVIISFQGFNSIITSTTLLFFLFGFFYIFPLFFLNEHNFYLLLPIDFDFLKSYKILLMSLNLFDNFILAFYSPIIKNGFKRKYILIGNTILIIYFLYITMDSITLLGANYYSNTKMAGFLRWQLFKGGSFFENYDIFLLIMITIITIYKLSIHFNLLRLLFSQKRKIKIGLIITTTFSILSLIAYHLIDYIQNNIVIISLFLLILIFIIYLFFCKKSQEVKFGNNNNSQ